ncbi:MAG TPA: RNA polymerase sigma factor RpoH [Acetobacteraceae bacterium]|jgi:RNA polymerase sigma-32 factor|nr:RNA polymerase sigma factor RpoH [Acetobacteraceae bacterium]
MPSVTHNIPFDGGLSRYLQATRLAPMLTAEEESRLAHLWRDKSDTEAADKLVTSHLRLVARIAAGYRGYGLPYGDLISEGNVGMMQAVRRFDPDRGFRLATYAMWWIRAAIQEYVLHSSSLVKMGTTAAQKKLFFNLRRLKGQMNALDSGDLPPEQASQIAAALDVPVCDVMTMNQRMAVPDQSLNAPVYDDGVEQWQDHMPDESESHETMLADQEEFAMRKARLAKVFHVLDEREYHIVSERWLKEYPTTLEKLASRYRVSRERIRQLEVRALAKLRKAMKVPVAPGPKAAVTGAVQTTAYA